MKPSRKNGLSECYEIQLAFSTDDPLVFQSDMTEPLMSALRSKLQRRSSPCVFRCFDIRYPDALQRISYPAPPQAPSSVFYKDMPERNKVHKYGHALVGFHTAGKRKALPLHNIPCSNVHMHAYACVYESFRIADNMFVNLETKRDMSGAVTSGIRGVAWNGELTEAQKEAWNMVVHWVEQHLAPTCQT